MSSLPRNIVFIKNQIVRNKHKPIDHEYRPYLLFDAGGTLVFPKADWIIKQLGRTRKELNANSLYKGYYKVIRKIDQTAKENGFTNNAGEPWTNEFAFEEIFDSADKGVEKPNPEIIYRALKKLDLDPAETIYIGYLYEEDVKGANQAGIASIHIDPLQKYYDLPGVRLKDIRQLPNWLAKHPGQPVEFCDLYPFHFPSKKNKIGISTRLLSKNQHDSFSGKWFGDLLVEL